MKLERWYIYRLMPQTDGDLYQLHREQGFWTEAAAKDWVFKSGNQDDRRGKTFLFRLLPAGQAPEVISLKNEAKPAPQHLLD